MPVDDSSQFIKSQQATLIQKELQASIYQWFAEKSLACFGSRGSGVRIPPPRPLILGSGKPVYKTPKSRIFCGENFGFEKAREFSGSLDWGNPASN